MRSQNGWSAGTPEQIGGLDTSPVPGTSVKLPQGVRRGDVATVLLWVAAEYHRTVEPLRAGWCWGYHFKRIEGSDVLSNHASGTAVDLNAPDHPMGRRGTYSAGQVSAIRRILAYCGGVVRWGGDYTGRADEMHWEIVGSVAAVARLADKIRAGNKPAAPTPAPRPPAAGRPAPGPAVKFPLPAGWYFGPKDGPDRSVSGYHGRRFAGRLDREWLRVWAGQLARRGWQIGKGRRWLGQAGNDGLYGPEYRALIEAFQRDQRLKVDGLLGRATWDAAYRNPVR